MGLSSRPCWRAASARSTTLESSIARVIGPTPPGFGEIHAATSWTDGSYDVPEGLISSFPVTTKNGDWEIVQGLEIDDFSRGRIDATTKELAEERDAVTELGLI